MAIPKPNIATAAKAKTTSAVVNAKVLAAAAKQSPLINPNQVQNQGTDGSRQDNKPRPGFEGPSPEIPEVSTPRSTATMPATAEKQQATLNNFLGLVSQTDAMKQLLGMGTSSTAAQSEKDKLKGKHTDLMGSTSTNNNPGIDQGFVPSPDGAALAAMVGGGKGGKNVMNPMAPYQGGSVGGELGAAIDASQSQSPQQGIGAQGKGAIMNGKKVDNPLTSAQGAEDSPDGVKAEKGMAEKAIDTVKKVLSFLGFNPTSKEVNEGVMNAAGIGANRAGGEFLEPEASQQTEEQYNKDHGRNFTMTQTLLDQIIVSKAGRPTSQGGSSDATPVDNGGIPQVVNDGSSTVYRGKNAINEVGMPVGPGVENVSGGNKGLDVFGRSNGAGAIDPGNEAGIPGGDPSFLQDPANAMPGNNPAPTLQSPVGTQENQSSSVSTTLAAGTRNLTLTGTAAINGTGNALDNLINGNGAANELRGEAGNDLLDGGAGRDQLTGGSGADRFRFATAAAFGTAQADRITDFSRSEGDRIEISRSAFGLATSASLSFQTVSNDADLSRALGSSTLLVQDLRNGSILFNQNGSAAGAGQGGVFAVVSQGLTLQASDFALGA
jgi:Ca2+-binding RTX toxin-like protein